MIKGHETLVQTTSRHSLSSPLLLPCSLPHSSRHHPFSSSRDFLPQQQPHFSLTHVQPHRASLPTCCCLQQGCRPLQPPASEAGTAGFCPFFQPVLVLCTTTRTPYLLAHFLVSLFVSHLFFSLINFLVLIVILLSLWVCCWFWVTFIESFVGKSLVGELKIFMI